MERKPSRKPTSDEEVEKWMDEFLRNEDIDEDDFYEFAKKFTGAPGADSEAKVRHLRVRRKAKQQEVPPAPLPPNPTRSLLSNTKKSNWRKIAESIGGEPDVPFEQALSNLAHAYVRDKAGKLMDFEVGFQLLKKSPDNTRAVGIFGFQVGNNTYMIPIFFLNGDLKGHELLYIKSHDVFVPLSEPWVNYILGRRPVVLGEDVPRDMRRLGVTPPYLKSLERSYMRKFSRDMSRVPRWAVDLLPDVAYLATTSPSQEKKFENVAGFADVFVKSGSLGMNFLIHHVAPAYPEVFAAIDRFYPGLLDRQARMLRSQQVKSASILRDLDPKPVQSKVSVYDLDRLSPEDIRRVGLSPKDRQTLLRDGFLVKDARSEEEKAKVYIDERLSLQNPTESGVYDVVFAPYKTKKCVVLLHPLQTPWRSAKSIVIPLEDNEDNEAILDYSQNIWTTKSYLFEEFLKWFEKLPDPDPKEVLLSRAEKADAPVCCTPESIKYSFIFLNDEAHAVGPFHVDFISSQHSDAAEALDDSDLAVVEVVFNRSFYIDGNRAPAAALYKAPESALRSLLRDTTPTYSPATLLLNPRRGSRLKVGRDSIMIPRNFKLLKIKLDSSSRSKLGDALTAQIELSAATRKVELVSRNPTIYVDNKPMSKKSAVIELVTKYGFSKKAADESISLAERRPGVKIGLLVKKAYGSPVGGASMLSGIVAPSFPEPPPVMMTLPTGQGVMVQPSDPQNVAAVDPNTLMPPQNPFDQTGLNPKIMEVAQTAARLGQKDVFDVSAMAGMLNVSSSEMVDKFMGDLLKGLDRLGRILFLFYWHRDEFEERYGRSDVVEIEDSLRNAFSVLGELVLKLKTKNVEPLPELGIDVDLSSIANN